MSALARRSVDRARAVRPILAALADPDAGVRRAAAAALGTLGQGSADVRAALETAAAATDGALRRAAERSLRLLAGRR
jgi:HEAT repeat protein